MSDTMIRARANAKKFLSAQRFFRATLTLVGTCLLAANAYGQESLIDVIQKSLPSIVTVTAHNRAFIRSPGMAAALDTHTGRLLVKRGVSAAHYDRVGAGVVIDAQGIVVTNAHIVHNAHTITVAFNDGSTINALPVFIAAGHDIAFIRIDPPENMRVLPVADSDAARLGDEIVFVGNSPLLKQTLAGGKIIGIGTHRQKGNTTAGNTLLIQTSINAYKGDSGGPILDRNGHLIGLMVAREGSVDYSSFAVPSNSIAQFYSQYKESQ